MTPTDLAPFEPQILSHSEQWVVVDKPAGWLTIPGRTGASGEAAPVLSDWLNQKFSKLWVVHRLDRETSGVILFARSAEAHRLANTWFRERKAKKMYYCLASGVPISPVFKLNAPIEGPSSITQIEVRESYQEGFLAKVILQTGRRHQIRIHLSGAGYPLWGDSLYKGLKEIQFLSRALSVPRVALHASELRLPTGQVFSAPFPADFSLWLDQLRNEGQRV